MAPGCAQTKAKRVSVNEVDADRIGTAGERGTHRVFENEPGKKQLPDGVAADFVAVSVSEFEERVGLMFKESSSGPTHSGRKPMASKVNKRIMKMAWEMMDDHDVVPACLTASSPAPSATSIAWWAVAGCLQMR